MAHNIRNKLDKVGKVRNFCRKSFFNYVIPIGLIYNTLNKVLDPDNSIFERLLIFLSIICVLYLLCMLFGYVFCSILYFFLSLKSEHSKISKIRKKRLNRELKLNHSVLKNKFFVTSELIVFIIFLALIIKWCVDIKTKKYIYEYNYIPNEFFFIITIVIYLVFAIYIYLMSKSEPNNCKKVIMEICRLQDVTDKMGKIIEQEDLIQPSKEFEAKELLNIGFPNSTCTNKDAYEKALLYNGKDLYFGYVNEVRTYYSEFTETLPSKNGQGLKGESVSIEAFNCIAILMTKSFDMKNLNKIKSFLEDKYDPFEFAFEQVNEKLLIHCYIPFVYLSKSYKCKVSFLIKAYESFEKLKNILDT